MTEANLKDLESVLRKQLGNLLILEDCVIKDLLPPGENYGSKILSVQAVIRKSEDAESEELYLIAKTPPLTEFQREIFDSPYTFKKEIFWYSEIIPFYKQLEIENGTNENKILDGWPKYFGSRLSMNSDNDFDDDAVILLENLKIRGYYCTERRNGCDWSHARLAIEAMAKIHALGMATKEKHPEFFEILKIHSKSLEIKNPDEWASFFEERLKEISNDPKISIYLDECTQNYKDHEDLKDWNTIPTEPWSTIIHSDFWANNMLFLKNPDTSEPMDIKFVDYQNYLFSSPMRELAFFIGSGLHEELINKVDELIDIYYNELIRKLKMLNCNTENYSRESFNIQIVKDARIEFTHCLCMLKIITMNVNADDPAVNDMKNLIVKGACGESHGTRMKTLVEIFSPRRWILKN